MKRGPFLFLLCVGAVAIGTAGCLSTPFQDDNFPRGTRPGSGPCEVGGASLNLQPSGFLAPSTGAAHWLCNAKTDSEGRPRFESWSGNTMVVNGGSTVLQLEYDLGNDEEGNPLPFTNRGVIMGVVGEVGYFYRQATVEGNTLEVELAFSPTITRNRVTVFVGIDRADPVAAEIDPGEFLEIPIDIVPVQSGELQVSLSWDTDADLDLFVTEPDGTRIFYGSPESDSGGELDLDSNAQCEGAQNQNENIFWPPGSAPTGSYTVEVFQYDPCGTELSSTWVVTVLAGGVPTTYSGTISADNIEDGIEVAMFDWPTGG